MRKNDGVTLIALVITVIVLATINIRLAFLFRIMVSYREKFILKEDF